MDIVDGIVDTVADLAARACEDEPRVASTTLSGPQMGVFASGAQAALEYPITKA